MTTRSDAWLRDVQLEIVGAGNTLLQAYINNTIRRFYQISGAYTKEFTRDTVADKRVYRIPPAADLDLLTCIRLAVNGSENYIPPKDQKAVPGYAFPTRYYECTSPGVIQLSFFPETQEDGLIALFQVAPRRCVTDLPDELGTLWYDAILKGTLSTLMLMRNRPWSDMNTGRLYAATFASKVAEARDVARRQYTNAETSWVYPRWV